jgi:hypothetical protein
MNYAISQAIMGLPAKLTERQIKFAELLVYNEGRMSPAECAFQAGYTTRPRQAASELRSPKYSPLFAKYIGELRAEVQEKYGITFERHLGELAKLRDEAQKKGAWSAAINAEIARGKAGGLYIDQKLVMTGNLDKMSEEELQEKMKQILEDHKNIINVTAEETTSDLVSSEASE